MAAGWQLKHMSCAECGEHAIVDTKTANKYQCSVCDKFLLARHGYTCPACGCSICDDCWPEHRCEFKNEES
jgi:hypothetical protein